MKTTEKAPAQPDIEALSQMRAALGKFNANATDRDKLTSQDEAQLSKLLELAQNVDTVAFNEARRRKGAVIGSPEDVTAATASVRHYVTFARGVEHRKIAVTGAPELTIAQPFIAVAANRDALANLGAQAIGKIDAATQALEVRIARFHERAAERSRAVDFWSNHEVTRPMIESVAAVFEHDLGSSALDHALGVFALAIGKVRSGHEDMPALATSELVNELRERAKATEAIAA